MKQMKLLFSLDSDEQTLWMLLTRSRIKDEFHLSNNFIGNEES